MNQNYQGFLKVRRGLYEHLLDGRLSADELAVYMILQFQADFMTGLVARVSAPFLVCSTGYSVSKNSRILRSLEKSGYIKRFMHRGQRTFYPLLINKFETSHGLIIRADKTLNLNEVCFQVKDKWFLTDREVTFKRLLSDFYVTAIKELKNIRTQYTQEDVSEDINHIEEMSY